MILSEPSFLSKLFPSSIVKLGDYFPFETFLQYGLESLEEDGLEEICDFVKGQCHSSGLFINRAVEADLYYTLFGFFMAKSLGLNSVIDKISEHPIETIETKDYVHTCCQVILLSVLGRPIPKRVHATFDRYLSDIDSSNVYHQILSMIALLYLKRPFSLMSLRFKLNNVVNGNSDIQPATTLAPQLFYCKQSEREEIITKLLAYYYGGGFRAIPSSPFTDLLSTSVCLFSLRYADVDLRTIAPDIYEFIDSLYSDGGFSACNADSHVDIEYTFYGVLALASLNYINTQTR